MGAMNDTGPTPLQWLLHEVDARMPAEHAATIRTILAPMAGQTMHITRRELVIEGIRASAAALLASGLERSVAVVRLARAHDISTRSAQRYIADAMTRRAEARLCR